MIKICILSCVLLAAACGDHHGSSTDVDGATDGIIDGTTGGDDGGSGSGGDGGPVVDGQVPAGCAGPDLTKPQCSNCIDDDGDGKIDLYDIHCTGPLDRDESSFSTGIPGDNVDPVKQDCFFDGNSGSGNDGCNIHVCCLLGAATVADCPIGANSYDPAQCPPPLGTKPLSQMCIDVCGALTPPGCDCFGCCTLCDPNNPSQCYDILANPSASPNCTANNLADPASCTRCVQQTNCGPADCGGTTCILCPGQDPSTLPASCNGTTSCPSGTTSCTSDAQCGSGQYCGSSQCCISVIG